MGACGSSVENMDAKGSQNVGRTGKKAEKKVAKSQVSKGTQNQKLAMAAKTGVLALPGAKLKAMPNAVLSIEKVSDEV